MTHPKFVARLLELGFMEIPRALSEREIAGLPQDVAFLKAIIADREQRLGKARGLFVEQRSKLELLAELQAFRDQVEKQSARIQEIIGGGHFDPLPGDGHLVKTVGAVFDESCFERAKRSHLQSTLDRVRLIWTAGTIGSTPAESVAWKSLLDEIRKEHERVSASSGGHSDGAEPAF